MNRLHRLLAGLAIAAVSLTACGGGGGGSATPKINQGQTSGAHHFPLGSPPPAFSARTSIGSVKVALALPKILTGSTAQAIRAHLPASSTAGNARRGASSAVRSTHTAALRKIPQFVDPGCGSCYYNVLDIYVDGTLIPNLDGQVGNGDSMYVVPTPDGTQNLNLPVFSNNQNDVVVVEWDGNWNYVLAMGETYFGNFTPGTTQNISLTMLQNTAYVGIVDALQYSAPQLLTAQSQPYYGLAGDCSYHGNAVARRTSPQGRSSPQTYNQLYNTFGLFSADGLGNFVAAAGYGGTSTPQITSEVSDDGGTTKAGQSSLGGLYLLRWDNNCDGVTINATTANPAYAIVADIYGPYQYTGFVPNGSQYPYYAGWTSAQGSYAYPYGGPFDSYGNATYGYQNCSNGSGPCPGGPYQGIWNLSWNYYYGWNPIIGYNCEGLCGGIYAPTAGGSVQIEDVYPPFSVSPDVVNSLLAVGQTATATINDPTAYSFMDGCYYANSENNGIVTVNGVTCQGNGSQFTLTAQGAGTTWIDFSDDNNRYYQIQVVVTTTSLPIQ